MICEQMITRDTVISRKSDILTAEVAGEIVLMSVSHWRYFGLNAMGSEIWKRLESSQAVSELCISLAIDYEGDAQEIERDVIDLLIQLDDRNLLEKAA
ncbi:PqqD family protein [Lacibacterium aquatile]|uniref:PqqD family protein n=1 Tax=Lacibacterium aquatile TaxID=1168082 RepID=A0ABW5DVH9_9PROT